MIRYRMVFVVLILMITAGCSGLQKKFPRRNMFVLSIEGIGHKYCNSMKSDGVGEASHTNLIHTLLKDKKFRIKEGLIIKPFGIAPEFDTDYFVYRVSKERYIDDYYNNFIVSPAEMITDEIKKIVYQSSCFRYVPSEELGQIRYRLWGRVINLYGDMQETNRLSAVMSIRLVLEKKTKTGFKPIINKLYSAFVPADGKDAADLVKAWDRCFEKIMLNFFNDFHA